MMTPFDRGNDEGRVFIGIDPGSGDEFVVATFRDGESVVATFHDGRFIVEPADPAPNWWERNRVRATVLAAIFLIMLLAWAVPESVSPHHSNTTETTK